jgi:hypothetical protein
VFEKRYLIRFQYGSVSDQNLNEKHKIKSNLLNKKLYEIYIKILKYLHGCGFGGEIR